MRHGRHWLVAAALLCSAVVACGVGPSGGKPAPTQSGEGAVLPSDAAPILVADVDYAALSPGIQLSISSGLATIVDDGLLVTAPSVSGGPSGHYWILPAGASVVTMKAAWGANGYAGYGFWGFEVLNPDGSDGLLLACWADNTPPELVRVAEKELIAVAPAGQCGPGTTMTLRVDTSELNGAIVVDMEAAGSGIRSYEIEMPLDLDFVTFLVWGEDGPLAIPISRIYITAE